MCFLQRACKLVKCRVREWSVKEVADLKVKKPSQGLQLPPPPTSRILSHGKCEKKNPMASFEFLLSYPGLPKLLDHMVTNSTLPFSLLSSKWMRKSHDFKPENVQNNAILGIRLGLILSAGKKLGGGFKHFFYVHPYLGK